MPQCNRGSCHQSGMHDSNPASTVVCRLPLPLIMTPGSPYTKHMHERARARQAAGGDLAPRSLRDLFERGCLAAAAAHFLSPLRPLCSVLFAPLKQRADFASRSAMAAAEGPQQTPPFTLAFETLTKYKYCLGQTKALETCNAAAKSGLAPSPCLAQRAMYLPSFPTPLYCCRITAHSPIYHHHPLLTLAAQVRRVRQTLRAQSHGGYHEDR
eukprot:COSAG05_NODE_3830_length_1816_cov_1.322656_2_plen_212_part_00